MGSNLSVVVCGANSFEPIDNGGQNAQMSSAVKEGDSRPLDGPESAGKNARSPSSLSIHVDCLGMETFGLEESVQDVGYIQPPPSPKTDFTAESPDSARLRYLRPEPVDLGMCKCHVILLS